MDIFLAVLTSGWNSLVNYLSTHVITCLVPALLIAGAIVTFVSQGGSAEILRCQNQQATILQRCLGIGNSARRLLMHGAAAFGWHI